MNEVLLVAPSEEFAARVAQALAHHGADIVACLDHEVDPSRLEELAEKAAAEGPTVIGVGPMLALAEQMRFAELVDQTHPEISVVLAAALTPEQWQLALRVGARDVVAPDADLLSLRTSFEHAGSVARKRRTALYAAATQPPPPPPSGRLVTVISPKGGSGKTVTSTNLAVALAQRLPERVALVDLDVQFGDVSMALRVDSQFSIANAVHGKLDSSTLRAEMVRHDSGLFVLCAPDRPEDGEDISTEKAVAVLRALTQQFDFVVVDTGAGLDDLTLAAVELATDVVFVSSTDVPSVRGVQKVIDLFERLQVTPQRRHLVLNRADARVGLLASDIALTTGLPISITLPSSRSVPTALNQGRSLMELDSRSSFARSLNDFAGQLMGAAPESIKKSGWRNR